MALSECLPLCFERYEAHVGGIVNCITDNFSHVKVGGWPAALEKYTYRDSNSKEGQQLRLDFYEKFRNVSNTDEWRAVASEILDWGGMDPLSIDELNAVLATTIILRDEEGDALTQIYSNRIASASKIYEMSNPHRWIIFDSYCAKGLQHLVHLHWTEHGEVLPRFLRFPWPVGRVGKPTPGFPHLGAGPSRQSRLGFIYSSWFCRLVASRLNHLEIGNIQWSAYHIEMVAFQLGHEL